MLKIFGILIVIMVSTLYGFYFSSRIKEREKKLRSYLLLINEIEDKIRCKISLEEIFSSCLSQTLLEYRDYRVNFKKEGLQKEDIKLLETFFEEIGLGDTKSGTELCRTYKELLGKKEKEAEQETLQKAKLYSVLGLFFGLFVAILLI